MLIALDVGNTNTNCGIFHDNKLIATWNLATINNRTSDEYGILIQQLLNSVNLRSKDVDGICISCVVPPLLLPLEEMAEKHFNINPLFVKPGIKTGMPVLYENPQEVGADRIANSIAAYEQYGAPVIVVDFGTATTFDAITKHGEYLGGAICPGIIISADALFKMTAKLPRVEVKKPPNVIGRNTVQSIQAGLFYGYVSLVEGMLSRIQAELGGKCFVIATGGQSHLISKEIKLINKIDPYLTLQGLKILYQKNQAERIKN
jgi:type III pantothenate kinase